MKGYNAEVTRDVWLTYLRPTLFPWRVKLSGIGQSKITRYDLMPLQKIWSDSIYTSLNSLQMKTPEPTNDMIKYDCHHSTKD